MVVVVVDGVAPAACSVAAASVQPLHAVESILCGLIAPVGALSVQADAVVVVVVVEGVAPAASVHPLCAVESILCGPIASVGVRVKFSGSTASIVFRGAERPHTVPV